MFICPSEASSTSEGSQRRKNMSSSWPKRLIVVEGTDERWDVSVISRALHLEDCINSFLLWFDAFRGHPESKEISFLNKPFAFKWVAFHVVGVQSRQHKINHL